MFAISSIVSKCTSLVASAFGGGGSTSGAFAGANDSNTRTSVGAQPLDTRKELTQYARHQLIRKSRWLCNNLGLVRRFVNGCARYTVGGGLSHIPATSDEEFNTEADEYFTRWADEQSFVDVRRRLNFWRMQKAVLRAMFRDGDCFAFKVPEPDTTDYFGNTVLGRPRLQWLEATRVGCLNGTSWGMERDQDGYQEGILTTPEGTPLKYRVLVDQDPTAQDLSKTLDYDADTVMHVLDDERATQLRGLPWLYHGVNSAIDILDLTSLEKHSHKLHAAMAAAIRKKSGDAGRGGFSGDLNKVRGKMKDSDQRKVTAYENFMGGAGILQLATDEEFQLFTSNRQSVTFASFIDFLVRDIAWGFGLSPEFIWAVSGLSGPNSRIILEDSKWFFEEQQDLLVSLFCKKVYTWVIGRAIARGEIKRCKDPRWWICDWLGPAKITIDQGRDGQLELDRLNNACNSWEDYWAARGKSGRQQVKKRIDELAWAMDYAKEKGVPFELVCPGKNGNPIVDAVSQEVTKQDRARQTEDDLDAQF